MNSATYTSLKRKDIFWYLKFTSLIMLISVTALVSSANAQVDTTFKPSGKLWMLAFGDYYYKAHADILNRGGGNQYTNIEKGRNAFQFRRIYLGYNYDITKKFSSELLLAAEENQVTSKGVTSGDLLTDNKFSFYIKLANLRWKGIWKGADLLIGQSATPAFMVSDPVWSYRAIEKTIADIRRTPAVDLGLGIQGKFDPADGNFGYNFLIGNGTSARPENNKFKWFYGDVNGKFFNKKLIIDLYADYARLDWTSRFHHSRNMIKGFAAYTTPAFTLGVEAFVNHGKNDVIGVKSTGTDTLSANAVGISSFLRAPLVKDKLGFFARVDKLNPDEDYDDSHYISDQGLTAAYEPNNKELLAILGLDFTPAKNIRFMPNVWYNRYVSQRSGLQGSAKKDYDLVYRLTFSYVFGR